MCMRLENEIYANVSSFSCIRRNAVVHKWNFIIDTRRSFVSHYVFARWHLCCVLKVIYAIGCRSIIYSMTLRVFYKRSEKNAIESAADKQTETMSYFIVTLNTVVLFQGFLILSPRRLVVQDNALLNVADCLYRFWFSDVHTPFVPRDKTAVCFRTRVSFRRWSCKSPNAARWRERVAHNLIARRFNDLNNGKSIIVNGTNGFDPGV